MKVDKPISPIGLPSAGPKAVRSTPTPPQQAPESGSHVQISSLSAQMHGAETSAVDVKRVAEIKQAISEGRFTINPEKIADGLLDSVRQMLHGRANA